MFSKSKNTIVIFVLLVFVVVAVSSFFIYSTVTAHDPQTYDLANSSNYNIRFKGASVGDKLGRFDSIDVADFDGDGIQDFIVGAERADNNERTDSGSLYYINGKLYNQIAGTGNFVELSDPSNYTIRYDGSTANGRFGYAKTMITDINNNGKPDILSAGFNENNNSRSASGSAYVILDNLISNYSGTGNNVDMADSNNWSMRFDGAKSGDNLGNYSNSADMNNNGKKDLILNATKTDYNTRSNSGSVWIIYDSLLDGFGSGPGKTIDMLSSSSYNLRFDGASADNIIGDVDINIVDIDNDNKLDLLVGSVTATIESRSNSGVIYAICNTLIDNYSNTGNNIDLAISDNYNIRFYGAANEKISVPPTTIGDINGDNKNDLIIGGQQSDYNDRTDSGSIYLIFNNIIEGYLGIGQSIDLTDDNNYNVRIDGAMAASSLSYHFLSLIDFNNDGLLDIASNAYGEANNGRQYSGSLYIFYNQLFMAYTGVGNKIDSANDYSLRYDGATEWMFFPGGDNMRLKDVNGDGKLDIIAGAAYLYTVDAESRDAGYVYLIYNFPHLITPEKNVFYTNNSSAIVAGTVSAENSTTNISMVQFSTEDGSLDDNWQNCSPIDGSFDSKNETFSCNAIVNTSVQADDVYLRAYDTNSSYTAPTKYTKATVVIDTDLPTVKNISINSGAYTAYSRNVTIDFEVEDATSSVEKMMISENPNFENASWEDYSATKTWTLSKGNAKKTVYAKFKDSAENVSLVISDSIYLYGRYNYSSGFSDNPKNEGQIQDVLNIADLEKNNDSNTGDLNSKTKKYFTVFGTTALLIALGMTIFKLKIIK